MSDALYLALLVYGVRLGGACMHGYSASMGARTLGHLEAAALMGVQDGMQNGTNRSQAEGGSRLLSLFH